MSKNEIAQALVKLNELMGAYIAANEIDWNVKDLVLAILDSPPPSEQQKWQRQRDVLEFARAIANLTTTECNDFSIELGVQRILDRSSTVSNAIINTLTRQYELVKRMKPSDILGYLIGGGSATLVLAARPEYASETREGMIQLIKLDLIPAIPTVI